MSTAQRRPGTAQDPFAVRYRSVADPSWWRQEKKSARKLRAMAVVNYARGRQDIDQARHEELRQAIPRTPHVDVPDLVGGLPVPRWDRVPPAKPVDRLECDFAAALLDVAHQAEVLSAPERKWRVVFAKNARTAGDLLVLFLDIEPQLSPRRADPALATELERLAFVPQIYEARSKGALSRPELDNFLKRTASGEDLDALRAELGVPQRPRPWVVKPGAAERTVAKPPDANPFFTKPADAKPPIVKPAVAKPAVANPLFTKPPVAEPAAKATNPRVLKADAPDRPVTDVDRARIAKHLQNALADERLTPGEHAARTVALWTATTSRDLAVLIVDLPAPANEPLRDRKPHAHRDDLITPTHRQATLDRLNRAMAGHALTLWEYETRLDVALKARTFEELWPATANLPLGW